MKEVPVREVAAIGYCSRLPGHRGVLVASCHRYVDTAEAVLNLDEVDACGCVVWCRVRGRMPYGSG